MALISFGGKRMEASTEPIVTVSWLGAAVNYVGLGGVIAALGFAWRVSGKVTRFESEQERHEERIAKIEGEQARFRDDLSGAITRVEGKLDANATQFTALITQVLLRLSDRLTPPH
jgi:hypothetical protein